MALLQFENVGVQYAQKTILQRVNLNIEKGSFTTIFGPSGSGKSTLLNQLRPTLNSEQTGHIYYEGKDILTLSVKERLCTIGFIEQRPSAQLVAEDVWHELAFNLENIGLSTTEMKIRIGEIANFFGIQHWFRQKIATLSGGQQQLLNLAATLVLHPKILVLDEPSSQLDPLAAKQLMDLLSRINQELGMTIIVVEHRLEDILPYTTHCVFINDGEVVLSAERDEFFQQFYRLKKDWFLYLPASVQLSLVLQPDETPAFTVTHAKKRLENIHCHRIERLKNNVNREILYELKDIAFRYGRLEKDVLRNVNLCLKKGEIYTLIGGNGSGKSTLLKVMANHLKPYQGKTFYASQRMKFTKDVYKKIIGYLPQDPLLIFLEQTVQKDYEIFCKRHGYTTLETAEKIDKVVNQLNIMHLLTHHPEDLSGGEQQLAAIGKLLLYEPTILLLDEPTKGLDPHIKVQFIKMLQELQQMNITIFIVTHDIEFAASVSDRCALFFDGEILVDAPPAELFTKHQFYTTTAHKIAQEKSPEVILTTELLKIIEQGEIYDANRQLITASK